MLIADAYDRTKKLLLDNKEGLQKLADKLLDKEILFQSDLEDILGKRPFNTRTTYDEFVNSEANNQEQITEDLVHDAVTDHPDAVENKPTSDPTPSDKL